VAIKTIRFDLASEETDNEEIMQRFIREAQAAGKLTHPNIITIFDVGREEDLTYIVMQYIEGPSLQRLIAHGEKFTVPEVTKLMEQVCSGLDFAHQHGIVHRDIKPGNILLDKNRRPYICDFGVARVDTSTLTQSGTAVGTPSYMSPEQVMGKKVDKRSDIFSVGCILYEFLTGRRPFEAESITTVIYKIINEEPPSLNEVKKGLPAGFEKVIGKALAKDSNDRYQNCNQLTEDLRNLDKLSDKTIAVTVTREAPILEEEEKEKEEEVAEEEKKKSRLGLILGVTIPAFLIIVAGGAYFYNEQTGNLPFVKDVVQKISGMLGVSSSPSPPIDNLTKEEKLNKAKESLEKGDYLETIRLAEAVLAEDAGNIAAQDYLNRAKEAMSGQSQAGEGPGVKPTPPPEDTDPRALKLNEIKQSFEKGSYNETVKLADAFLAENPDDTTALDYKNKAETQILINTILQTGISHYKNRRYSQCMREMEKIFKLEKDHKDARKYWGLSDRAIFEAAAKKEILSIVETVRKAEMEEDLAMFDIYIGSSSLKDLKISELRWIFNNFDDINSVIEDSSISIEFKNRTQAEVKFFNFSSAVSKQTGQNERIFEGDIIWTMEKQGNTWKIIKEEKQER